MVQPVTVDFFQTSVFKMVEKIKLFFSIKNLYFSNFQHKNHKHFYEKKILLKHQAIPLFTLFFLPKTEENTEAYSISTGSLAVFYKSIKGRQFVLLKFLCVISENCFS